MAKVTGTVEAVSTKYDKYSIMVNDTWYGTKMEYADVKPNRGDIVEFDDGGKKYTSRMKIVTAGAGGSYGSPKPSSPGGRSGYSNLGVELGHAANLAIQVLAQVGNSGGDTLIPGTKEYWKEFQKQTRVAYAVMKGLREEYEGTKEPAEEVVVMKKEEETAAESPETPSELDDIF